LGFVTFVLGMAGGVNTLQPEEREKRTKVRNENKQRKIKIRNENTYFLGLGCFGLQKKKREEEKAMKSWQEG